MGKSTLMPAGRHARRTMGIPIEDAAGVCEELVRARFLSFFAMTVRGNAGKRLALLGWIWLSVLHVSTSKGKWPRTAGSGAREGVHSSADNLARWPESAAPLEYRMPLLRRLEREWAGGTGMVGDGGGRGTDGSRWAVSRRGGGRECRCSADLQISCTVSSRGCRHCVWINAGISMQIPRPL
jgi:hypothetical protein